MHFHCEQCGALVLNFPRGRIAGCDHYPAKVSEERMTLCERSLVRALRDNDHQCQRMYQAETD